MAQSPKASTRSAENGIVSKPRWSRPQEIYRQFMEHDYPWLGWAFVYTFTLFFLFIYRCVALSALISMYATADDATVGVVLGALTLGFLEDFVCVTYFACSLWLFDKFKPVVARNFTSRAAVQVFGKFLSFSISWLLFVVFTIPVVADVLIVRLRDMRFTFDIIVMAIQEKDNASSFEVSSQEITDAYVNASALALAATAFAITGSTKNQQSSNYVQESPVTEEMETDEKGTDKSEEKNSKYVTVDINDTSECSEVETTTSMDDDSDTTQCLPLDKEESALNTTVNELFGHAFQPNVDGRTYPLDDINLPWVETYIHHATENHELFGNDTLYRRTTGFQGKLAFDVNVDQKDPPNVLLLVIESFRFHDSHYLVGEKDPSNLFKGNNMTITPNFDRSVESLLFAQLPYDHVTKSGMTGGQRETNLSGLPQLFTSKGFQLLGDLFVNKTKEQSARVAKGEAKKPLFLTHYTISSHVNYKQRPKWYDKAEKPDFSALYKGQKYARNIKNYLEIRYFTDMEFGKFMDRMAAAGILEDTIVVISGDHGQGPEFGNKVPEDRDVSVTRVAGAIVAEGRLGNAVGMVMDDATEQYDILNTLADITGVPEGGFVQDGVGRSLKRKIKFGERIVYSNNPTRKMSVVRGHERLRYDKVTDSMLLHNADTDHDMEKDLLPTLLRENDNRG
eukprot:jgi/Phyca11/536400/estExt2_fgenesh1_pg.C_PHYCAscaffold_520057